MNDPADLPFTFSSDGRKLTLSDPAFIANADSDLWNERMSLTANQRGWVKGRVLTPNPQTYCEDQRILYLSGPDWPEPLTLPWGPANQTEGDFTFDVSPERIRWERRLRGVRISMGVAVPRNQPVECWHCGIKNESRETLELTLTLAIPTGLLGLLAHESELSESPFGLLHRYFRYYVKLEDYEKLARCWNWSYCFPSRQPDSWTAEEESFLGFGTWSRPQALGEPALPGRHVHYRRGIFALRFHLSLPAGEEDSLGWILGAARDRGHALSLRDEYPPGEAYAGAVAEQEAFHREQRQPLEIRCPDAAFAHFANHWATNRCLQIGHTLRFNPSPQARNAIQDSMALAYFDPAKARENFLQIWSFQETSGFMPHGLPLQEGADIMPITLIPHKDTNVWGPLALDAYLRETGDFSILHEQVPYADGPAATLAAHIEQGLRWLLRDRGERGLSRIGQGDWNDPLNMVGPEEKGESVWLTEALVVACELWAAILEHENRDAAWLRKEAECCRAAVRSLAWDGDWFVRAFTDKGEAIGSRANKEGSIFLNAQSWALLARIADEEQTVRMIEAVDHHLGNPIAPAVLAPPFSGMDTSVGKISLKSPGTGENGSIYCHAALFWICALYGNGQGERAWTCFRNLLPGGPHHSIRASGQLPLSVPNFYRGPASPGVFGQSSHSPTTGSAAWYYRILMEDVFGAKAEFDGLRLQPCLPSDWEEARATRRFRGSTWNIHYRRDPDCGETEILVDGEPSETLLPLPEKAGTFEVQVTLPTRVREPSFSSV